MLDLIIKNARVIDGTGAPWFRADVGVKSGKIAAIGKLSCEAAETVDANDLYLSPGFIDVHSHSDSSILDCPLNHSRILQGVTSEIAGNCGMSMAPAADETLDLLRGYAGWDKGFSWRGVGSFLDEVGKARASTNFGTLVGHGTIRIAEMGFSADKPTAARLENMKAIAAEAMREGAFGMSSGLIYPPGSYAETDELAEIASAIAPFSGYYATHMRYEGKNIVMAVAEAIETARRAGVPLQISHHKATHKPDWQVSCKTTIAMIERARREGLDVTADQYPYRATATTLSVNVPGWAFVGGFEALRERLGDPSLRARIHDEIMRDHLGRWDTLFVSYLYTPENYWMRGKSIPYIAEKLGRDEADALLDIVLAENDRVGEIHFGMCEEDIEYIMKQSFVMTGSDGSAMPVGGDGRHHPRNLGTFPRVIAHYCRERKLFPLEEAVRKLTSMPAARAGLSGRGIIKEGMAADLVLFDFEKINDDPTYEDPERGCSGIARVYVNGALTAANGEHTGARAGMVLKKG